MQTETLTLNKTIYHIDVKRADGTKEQLVKSIHNLANHLQNNLPDNNSNVFQDSFITAVISEAQKDL